MTATPRQLSDAIEADFDELVAERTAETASIARWTLARTISGWIAGATAFGFFVLMVLTILTGSLLGFILLVGAFFAAPFIVVPAAVVWLVATFTVARLEEKRREAMFTQYGITIDRGVTPHIYSVAIPAAWVKPELHRTRALLLADTTAAEE